MNHEIIMLLMAFFIACWSCAWMLLYIARELIKENKRFKWIAITIALISRLLIVVPFIALVQELGFL